MEQPIACRDFPAFHFHATLTGMLSPTLIRHKIVQVCQPSQKGLLTSTWVVEAFHREQFPLDGLMRLVQERAGHRHLGVFKDGVVF